MKETRSLVGRSYTAAVKVGLEDIADSTVRHFADGSTGTTWLKQRIASEQHYKNNKVTPSIADAPESCRVSVSLNVRQRLVKSFGA